MKNLSIVRTIDCERTLLCGVRRIFLLVLWPSTTVKGETVGLCLRQCRWQLGGCIRSCDWSLARISRAQRQTAKMDKLRGSRDVASH